MELKCFNCDKIDIYNESKPSFVTTLFLDNNNKYFGFDYSCFDCSPTFMVSFKSALARGKEKNFKIPKCELCGNITVNFKYGSLSPYLCYKDKKYIICCSCVI
jgi:hypothetical protein